MGVIIMNFLFNSKGEHVATLVNGQLHSSHGKNIGHYIENSKIFIDMHGRYMGELVHGNRLVYNRNSKYKSENYGNYGNYENIENCEDPGSYDAIKLKSGYKDINILE